MPPDQLIAPVFEIDNAPRSYYAIEDEEGCTNEACMLVMGLEDVVYAPAGNERTHLALLMRCMMCPFIVVCYPPDAYPEYKRQP